MCFVSLLFLDEFECGRLENSKHMFLLLAKIGFCKLTKLKNEHHSFLKKCLPWFAIVLALENKNVQAIKDM